MVREFFIRKKIKVNTFFKTWQPSILLFFFYSFFAIALLAPIASEQMIPAMLDYANHIAMVIEAKMAIIEGQFPLRVTPMELGGWRYPSYQFYSPSTYTFAGLIYKWFIPNNPILAVKFTMGCGLVAGGMLMQQLAYWLVKSRPAAILASIVYLTAPYYIIVVAGFGNLNEAVALGILPGVIYYTLQRYRHPNENKTLLQTALAWYLLITIHLVTCIYTALFSGFLLLLATYKKQRHWKNLLATGISMAFGCLLAMWYLGPIGLLEKYFLIAQTFSSASYFKALSPSLSYLLFPGHFQFQGSLEHNYSTIGLPILTGACLCYYALLNKFRINSRRANYWLPSLLLLFLFAFIMVWSPVNFWDWLPQLFRVGQYPWRFLSQLIWIGALLFAWAACWLFHNKLDTKHTIIGLFLLIITASSALPILNPNYFNINLQQFIKHPSLIFNPNAYTIEFNKHTGFVNAIDEMRLESLMKDNILQLATPYSIPQALLRYAAMPVIYVQGTITEKIRNNQKLNAIINNLTIATFNLKSGKFYWKIPLTPAALAPFKNKKNLLLQFKIQKKTKNNTIISIDTINLSGFLKSTETVNVKRMQPHCQQQKITTICTIKTEKTTRLIELPILFYPKLLHITVNGQEVPYQGIVYQNNLIAGIVPQPGKINIIKIQFRGLMWANYTSWLSWGVWLGLLAAVCIRCSLQRIHFIYSRR
jgi:hypothetical protein